MTGLRSAFPATLHLGEELRATDNAFKVPEAWRNHGAKRSIAATRLQRGDLRRLYRLINDQQIEYRDKVIGHLALLPNEGQTEFEARKKRCSGPLLRR